MSLECVTNAPYLWNAPRHLKSTCVARARRDIYTHSFSRIKIANIALARVLSKHDGYIEISTICVRASRNAITQYSIRQMINIAMRIL